MSRKPTSEERHRYDVLNRMLRDRQAEIRNRLRSLREVMPAKDVDVKDAEEQSMEDFVRDMDVALIVMESETLRRIDEALLKLDAGTYGVCAACDETIAEPRLKALPFATLCRDCQEREEEADESPLRPGARRPVYEEPARQEGAGRQRAAWQHDASIQRTLRMARSRA
ncbi:MAG TPA: TraR/DksA C4-type zinc finger protein [Vicinamibacteria bacterium]|nr:TraR/DksA C4-type zinc finger protein [Vicinamibacteria bacterium]